MAEPAPPTEMSSEEDRFRTLKAEVDALQIAAMKSSEPWYQNASTLIAAFALLISLGTTIFSYFESIDQENWALRAELRSLILRLNDLPLKNYELQLKYRGDELVAGDLAGYSNNENSIIATHAAEIIKRIPSMVSGAEIMSVAVALRNSNQLGISTDMLRAGLEGENNSDSMVAILRNLALNSFLGGNPDKGREYYIEALGLFNSGQFTPPSAYYEFITHALTEMYWAQQEAFISNCNAWNEHIGKANDYLEKAIQIIPTFPGQPNPVRDQINKTASFGCHSQ